MNNVETLRVKVTGIVQGVGFRPFVYTIAIEHDLKGWVRNSSAGVEMVISGESHQINAFLLQLQNSPPPLARIDQINTEKYSEDAFTKFEIITSQPQAGAFVPISPDIAICSQCQSELFDQHNRRFRYPFINCTNCGPRFTIIQDIPYDRPKTTMAGFCMCDDCHQEYENPLNRRFHAQPIACPVCGPQMVFTTPDISETGEDAIQLARKWLKKGKIIAVKGLGGYHLACDASNDQAVKLLRNRKQRSDKPFAIMAFDLQIISRYCHVSETEAQLLNSPQHPVVILQQKGDSAISQSIAPHQNTLGVMLPYTPLHLLLLEPEPGFPDFFVMTSGNISEEPIAYKDSEADERLAKIADGFLAHNREIHMRTDDSVLRVAGNRPYPIRRSRGYAPDSISLPFKTPQLLASGADLKNTFCLTREQYAFVSHHIGDLENFETIQSYEDGIRHFEHLFHIKPVAIAHDMHPDYHSTRHALQRAEAEELPALAVQHHHAHLAACLADNSIADTEQLTLGVVLDGTGYGGDQAIWGGEFLLGNYRQYTRPYHLEYMPLPGGDAATRHPARTCLSYLWKTGHAWSPHLPPVSSLSEQEKMILQNQLQHTINTHPTSSMGRLFDVVSSLLGICQAANYEGQAAIELENLCAQDEYASYPFEIEGDRILIHPFLQSILNDLDNKVNTPHIAARFHNTIIAMIENIAQRLRRSDDVHRIALSGGVWQNMFLLERTITRLRKSNFEVLWHRQVPTNDGGIALGQAAIAAVFYNREN